MNVQLNGTGQKILWVILALAAAWLLANGGGIEKFLGF